MKTNEKVICALFVALIAVGAFLQITIPLPIYPMHFTLQWFFVLMAGLMLGTKLGTISVALYLGAGLVGLPVFAAGGGPQYVLRPGFGFLLGFLLAAFVMGLLVKLTNARKFWQYLWIAVVGEVLYYMVGAIYFYLIKNIYAGTAISWKIIIVEYCLITVFPDFILCALAAKLTVRLKPVLMKDFIGKD